MNCIYTTCLMCFNSRPRAEGDIKNMGRAVANLVSIHALARRATRQLAQHGAAYNSFNSRPRAEGDVIERGALDSTDLFQCTPSRGGRLDPHFMAFLYEQVSIHALARRATGVCIRACVAVLVSIHALARRATTGKSSAARSESFNSRPRAEGDRVISHPSRTCRTSFNSRPRAEGD